MDRNKYLLLFSSLGVLALLVVAAAQENFARDWRRIQGQGRTEEGPIPTALRQIVNPGLRTTDRCVSCHVSMAPGEQGVVGADVLRPHPNVYHDPSEFGCTICHGGQGQATEKADAHGDVEFWPDPMLPSRFAYAGCGSCHATLGVSARPAYERAKGAFQRLDCLACHRVDGRGGTIRPGGHGMEGPDLSLAGAKGYAADWYESHLAQAESAAGGPWKNSFRAVSEEDRALVAAYLETRVGMDPLIEAKATFLAEGCLGCHRVSSAGGDEGPELTRGGEIDPALRDFTHVPGAHVPANWLAEHFRSPAALVEGSRMPPVALPGERIEELTMFVLSLRRRDLPESFLPKERLRVARFGEREYAADGETIFRAYCAGCHGPQGAGRRAAGVASFPSVANPDLHRLVDDEFLLEAVTNGRPGRRMPAWGTMDGGLRPEEIGAVVAHLRRLSGEPPPVATRPVRWVQADTERGQKLYVAACEGCHGSIGQGGEAPALLQQGLLAQGSDTFFYETIAGGRRGTRMPAFSRPSTVHPTLAPSEIEAVVAFLRTWEKVR